MSLEIRNTSLEARVDETRSFGAKSELPGIDLTRWGLSATSETGRDFFYIEMPLRDRQH